MKLIRRRLVLGALLGTVFLGLLVLLVGQLLESWTSSTNLRPPSPKISLRKFEWQAWTPHPLDLNYPYPYPFLINHPDKCKGPRGAPFLLMLVMTQPHEVGVRQVIRQTWGNETLIPGVVICRLFVLGLPRPIFAQEIQVLLEEEDREYGDLLQVGFLDTYRNLTLKVLMGLEWMAHYCPTARYVLKVDNDVFLNPSFLVHQLLHPNQPPQPNFITGHIYTDSEPQRSLEDKWYMPPELYPQEKYPVYCGGPGYVLSVSLALRVLTVAQRLKAIYLEDVFIGLCIQELGVQPTPAPPDTFLIVRQEYEHCAFHQLALVHQYKPQELLQLWPDFQAVNDTCPQE
ncbi:beta-1,3-galactosyltransferase 2-like [Monodelphis domestica]|uniref:beta-1,3-galactosyltransferase 2-like n=1 Tax=Monodelphis domestica TaxID=13616 RepID=UPI00020F6442|nr:beta-1,3-galactosyltransferase 2-like [Monodelphis domestica]